MIAVGTAHAPLASLASSEGVAVSLGPPSTHHLFLLELAFFQVQWKKQPLLKDQRRDASQMRGAGVPFESDFLPGHIFQCDDSARLHLCG